MTVEQKAEEKGVKYADNLKPSIGKFDGEEGYSWSQVSDAWIDGYKECQKEHKGKCKTAYIKGIRTMANALKDYDRTDGAWTDYFEHKVDEVLNRLLKESE